FDLGAEGVRPLWRQKFAPAHRNVYRGWFPLQRGFPTAKEGIDMGADVAYGAGVVVASDPPADGDATAAGGVAAGLAQRDCRLLPWHGDPRRRADAIDCAQPGIAGAVL